MYSTDDLWTIGEVATYLKVSEKSVYRRVRDIPGAFKLFNGTWRFHRQIILGWVLSLSKRPTEKIEPLSKDDRHRLLER